MRFCKALLADESITIHGADAASGVGDGKHGMGDAGYAQVARRQARLSGDLQASPSPRDRTNFAGFDRAREVLGFEPKVDGPTGLERTWRWYRDVWSKDPRRTVGVS